MAAHPPTGPVAVLCEVLAVSRSGFDASVTHPHPVARQERDRTLCARVYAMATATRARSGRRRMAKQLQAEGFAVGRAQARRLMRQTGVVVTRRPRRGPVTTDSRHGAAGAPNGLARQFAVATADQAWVGDIS